MSIISYIISAAWLLSTVDAFVFLQQSLPKLSSPAQQATISIQQQRRSGHANTSSARDNSCLHASPTSGSGFGSSKKKKTRTYGDESSKRATATSISELFELQELRAQLQTILKENFQYQTLSNEKREELTKYVKAVVEKSQTPIDFSGRSDKMGTAKFVAGLEGKSWRMVFSTDPSGEGQDGDGGAELPYGSTVIMRIGEFMGCDGKMDYVLKFSKQIMGLRELVAKSTCSVDVSSEPILSFCVCNWIVNHFLTKHAFFDLVS